MYPHEENELHKGNNMYLFRDTALTHELQRPWNSVPAVTDCSNREARKTY